MTLRLHIALIFCFYAASANGQTNASHRLEYSCNSNESLSIYLQGPNLSLSHVRTLQIKACPSLVKSLLKGPQRFQNSISIAYCYRVNTIHLKGLRISSTQQVTPIAFKDVVTQFVNMKSCVEVSDILNENKYDVWEDAVQQPAL